MSINEFLTGESGMHKRMVFFLMSGTAHAPYLAVSLHTLRKHYQGPVTIHAWAESVDIARKIASDPRLGGEYIQAKLYDPPFKWKRNNQFGQKILIAQGWQEEAKTVLYLDADTTVHDSVNLLFEAAEDFGFCATRFNEWLSCGKTIKGRLNRLRGVSGIPDDLIDKCTTVGFPSVNGGVWACRPNSPILEDWFDWTRRASTDGHKVFIADEAVLHLMLPKYMPSEQIVVADDGGRWNCSPTKQSENLADKDVAIRHYHGDSNCRINKSLKGVALWWPLYEEALADNVGGIADWIGEIDNGYLRQCEEHVNEHGIPKV